LNFNQIFAAVLILPFLALVFFVGLMQRQPLISVPFGLLLLMSVVVLIVSNIVPSNVREALSFVYIFLSAVILGVSRWLAVRKKNLAEDS
jgi:hypothetical protein